MIRRLLTSAFILSSLPVRSGESSEVRYDSSSVPVRQFNSKELNQHLASGDFDYEQAQGGTSLLERLFNWLWEMLGIEQPGRAFLTFNQILEWVLIITGVALLLYALFRLSGISSPFTRKPAKDPYQSGKQWQEELPEDRLQSLLEDAIRQGEFRKAVRLQYLKILRQLDNAGMIRWQTHKTNRDFIRELSGTQVEKAFRSFVRSFNYTWYGHFKVDQDRFEAIRRNALSIEQELTGTAS